MESSEALLSRIAERLDALERKLDAAAPWAADPLAVATMARIAARLDRLEALVEAGGTFAERLPVIGDAVGSTAAWAWQQAEAQGVDPIITGERAAALGLTLARPENLALAEAALGALNGADPADVAAALRSGVALLKAPEVRALIAASADPAALSTASAATTALVATGKEPHDAPGIWAMLGKLGDVDVRRAMGFGLSLAKRFGAAIGRG